MRFHQIKKGYPDPFQGVSLPRLDYVMKGIKRRQASMGMAARKRILITPTLLRKLKEMWSRAGGETDTKLIWAASCICFLGFLRAGKITVANDSSYDPTVHLSLGDIALDNNRRPFLVRVTIKQSKTDPFRKGVGIFVGRTESDICPVAALLDYWQSGGRRRVHCLFF